MQSLSVKAILLCTAFAVGFASAAGAEDQKPRKQKRHVAAHSAKISANDRGQNLFPAGPLYNGQDYLGDDPDPFIRSQIWRDLSGRYGGDN